MVDGRELCISLTQHQLVHIHETIFVPEPSGLAAGIVLLLVLARFGGRSARTS